MTDNQSDISREEAEELLAGPLGNQMRAILAGCMVPIFCFETPSMNILDNGTITIVNTGEKILGITASHVIEGFRRHAEQPTVKIQIGSCVVPAADLFPSIIDNSAVLDIATLNLSGDLLARAKPDLAPLSSWPPLPPQEGRGIMVGGYPGIDRNLVARGEVDFGILTVIGTARVVTDDQITWAPDPEHINMSSNPPPPPQNHPLGGMSGGPLLAALQTPSGFWHYRLAGIVSEAHSELANIIAKRADYIGSGGRIGLTYYSATA